MNEPALNTPGGSTRSVAMGALLIVLAFACVAVMSAFGKAAKDVPTGILVLFQNLISLLLFTPWALGKGVSQLRTSRTWLHILRAAAGLLSQVLMFVAVKRMPLVNAVLGPVLGPAAEDLPTKIAAHLEGLHAAR